MQNTTYARQQLSHFKQMLFNTVHFSLYEDSKHKDHLNYGLDTDTASKLQQKWSFWLHQLNDVCFWFIILLHLRNFLTLLLLKLLQQ